MKIFKTQSPITKLSIIILYFFIYANADASEEANNNLVKAIRNNDLAAVQKALKDGADVNHKGSEKMGSFTGVTPIQWAAAKADAEIINELINAGVDVHDTNNGVAPIHIAAREGRGRAVIQTLVSAGADIHETSFWSAIYGKGASPIQMATKIGDEETMQALIDAGVDVNKGKGFLGTTPPIYYAAELEDPKGPMNTLLSAGADVMKHGPMRSTALHRAAELGNMEAIQILLLAGADPEKKDLFGDTAYDRAKNDEVRSMMYNLAEQKTACIYSDQVSVVQSLQCRNNNFCSSEVTCSFNIGGHPFIKSFKAFCSTTGSGECPRPTNCAIDETLTSAQPGNDDAQPKPSTQPHSSDKQLGGVT